MKKDKNKNFKRLLIILKNAEDLTILFFTLILKMSELLGKTDRTIPVFPCYLHRKVHFQNYF